MQEQITQRHTICKKYKSTSQHIDRIFTTDKFTDIKNHEINTIIWNSIQKFNIFTIQVQIIML